ncbi:MAG: transcription antitermination factor NusB [Lentisphaeraceae bacterium]|nr:transcription antitermination factor NusB [Lentisphaeraceae bacterium]
MAKSKKLTPRRMAREWAMQFLFQNDVRESELDNDDLDLFWAQLQNAPVGKREREFNTAKNFADELIRGVFANKADLDATIQKFSEKWSVGRMSVTDRNILRIAAFEIIHSDLAPQIPINEAVEISKSFGDKDSPKYINAILDNISKDCGKGA